MIVVCHLSQTKWHVLAQSMFYIICKLVTENTCCQCCVLGCCSVVGLFLVLFVTVWWGWLGSLFVLGGRRSGEAWRTLTSPLLFFPFCPLDVALWATSPQHTPFFVLGCVILSWGDTLVILVLLVGMTNDNAQMQNQKCLNRVCNCRSAQIRAFHGSFWPNPA